MAALKLLLCISAVLAGSAAVLVQTDDVQLLTPASGITNGDCNRHGAKDLVVNCTMLLEQANNGTKFDRISSLVLSKAEDSLGHSYSTIASLSSAVRDLHVQDSLCSNVSGQLPEHGESFISYEWTIPSSQAVGLYKCDAYGLDENQYPLYSTANATITEQMVDDVFLQNLDDMMTSLVDGRQHLKDLVTMLDKAKDITFQATSTYNGHEYLMSYPTHWDMSLAESNCQVHGGYLVEINGRNEYNIVKNLLNRNSRNGVSYVMIGMTDVTREGNWKFMYSGGSVNYLNWANGQPEYNGNRPQDCAVMGNYGYYDTSCYDEGRYGDAVYICEITS